MVHWEPIKSGTDCRNACSRFCNSRATGRQKATTMRANCNHELSQPGLLICEESKRFECNFREPAVQKHIANPVCWAVTNRDSHIPDAYFCVLCCGVHLFRASTGHVRRPVDSAYFSPIFSKQPPSPQNHHKPIDKQGDSQNASCTAIERYEAVDLFNGMQMGGQWDRNRRALRRGAATRRQTRNVVLLLSGSCTHGKHLSQTETRGKRRHCSSIDS
jgi:hypothetical protein